MAPHCSILSPSFFSILLLNAETVTDRTFIYLACTHHFNHLMSVTTGGPEFPRGHMIVAKFYVRLQLILSVLRASKFSVLKLIEIVISWALLHGIPFGFSFFWYFWDISFQLLNYFVWLRITDGGSVPEMRIRAILLMKSDVKWCIHLDFFFIFQPLHSLGECHCWWARESLRAHAAKFYGRLQLIRSVSRASIFSVLKFIEIVIFGGLFIHNPFWLQYVFGTFVISLFNFFSYPYY